MKGDEDKVFHMISLWSGPLWLASSVTTLLAFISPDIYDFVYGMWQVGGYCACLDCERPGVFIQHNILVGKIIRRLMYSVSVCCATKRETEILGNIM